MGRGSLSFQGVHFIRKNLPSDLGPDCPITNAGALSEETEEQQGRQHRSSLVRHLFVLTEKKLKNWSDRAEDAS